MKNIVFTIIICLIGSSLFSQSDESYSKWQKEQQEKYEHWKRAHQSTEQGTNIGNAEQQNISNFINEGFNNSGNSVPQKPNVSSNPNEQNLNPGTSASINVNNINIWAVVVGVAAYRNINSLSYTDDDAYLFYAFLRSPEGGALQDDQIRVLIDEDANRKNIIKTMNEIYSDAKKDDAIIFYFSGHGAEGALITHDFGGSDGGRDANGKMSGVLLHTELNHIFENSAAKYKYMIIDACHAGSSENSGLKNLTAAETANSYYSAMEESKGGLVMLLSSMGDEVSIEAGGVRQGIFSYNIIEGLKGKADVNNDKVITVVELFDFVSTNVKKYTNYKQNPVISGNYEINMPIGVVR